MTIRHQLDDHLPLPATPRVLQTSPSHYFPFVSKKNQDVLDFGDNWEDDRVGAVIEDTKANERGAFLGASARTCQPFYAI